MLQRKKMTQKNISLGQRNWESPRLSQHILLKGILPPTCNAPMSHMPPHGILGPPGTAEFTRTWGCIQSLKSQLQALSREWLSLGILKSSLVCDRPQTCPQGCIASSLWTISLLGSLEYLTPSRTLIYVKKKKQVVVHGVFSGQLTLHFLLRRSHSCALTTVHCTIQNKLLLSWGLCGKLSSQALQSFPEHQQQ